MQKFGVQGMNVKKRMVLSQKMLMGFISSVSDPSKITHLWKPIGVSRQRSNQVLRCSTTEAGQSKAIWIEEFPRLKMWG